MTRHLCLAMVASWNSIVQSHFLSQDVCLIPRRTELLLELCDTVFSGRNLTSLEAWKSYCTTIANTRFLLGENSSGFRVTLDWALNLANARKILEGAIYDKADTRVDANKTNSQQNLSTSPRETFVVKLTQRLSDHPHSQEWLALSLQLAKDMGIDMYESWFSASHITHIDDNTMTLQFDTLFKRNWMASRYWLDIKKAVQAVFPQITQINFEPTQRL